MSQRAILLNVQLKIAMSASSKIIIAVIFAMVNWMHFFLFHLNHCLILWFIYLFPTTFSKLCIYVYFHITVIAWLSLSIYTNDCHHDTCWTLVSFMIADSTLINISRLYGWYQHMHATLIYRYCVLLFCWYIHEHFLTTRFLYHHDHNHHHYHHCNHRHHHHHHFIQTQNSTRIV